MKWMSFVSMVLFVVSSTALVACVGASPDDGGDDGVKAQGVETRESPAIDKAVRGEVSDEPAQAGVKTGASQPGEEEPTSCGYTAVCGQCYDYASKECTVYYCGIKQYKENFPCHWDGF
jgi:hypothetical protein